jgi:Tfp pilus assembly protein FimT
MSWRAGRNGFSVFELVFAVIIIALMAGVAMPVFVSMMRTSGANAAARQVAADVARARSLAIQTGWEYRVFGGNGGGGQSYANRYRVEGRRPPNAWPLATEGAVSTANKVSEEWFDVDTAYKGVVLNPSNTNPSFSVAFNSLGGVSPSPPPGFPLQVSKSGSSKSVSVSAAGSVRVQ